MLVSPVILVFSHQEVEPPSPPPPLVPIHPDVCNELYTHQPSYLIIFLVKDLRPQRGIPRCALLFWEHGGFQNSGFKTTAQGGINWKGHNSLLPFCLLAHWHFCLGRHLTSATNWDGSALGERGDDFTPYHCGVYLPLGKDWGEENDKLHHCCWEMCDESNELFCWSPGLKYWHKGGAGRWASVSPPKKRINVTNSEIIGKVTHYKSQTTHCHFCGGWCCFN